VQHCYVLTSSRFAKSLKRLKPAPNGGASSPTSTPGGGKSALPVILAAELMPKLFKKICWVVPRVALQQQAEEAFVDPLFRKLLNHQHLIRVSTSEINPTAA
jgi:hypothetical protein